MNTNTNLFEMASKLKFRYPYKGWITTEDLWDLNQKALDEIYKTLTQDLKKLTEASLYCNKCTEDAELETKIEIVKYIFQYKEESDAQARKAIENKAKRQRILEVLAKKQDDSLNNMSEEDLKKMLEELE